MKDDFMDLQHFANGANSVVNYAGDDNVAQAGAMDADNYAGGTGDLSPEMKTFYDKALITLASPKLVHEQFARKKPIPKNGGKTIEFRKFSKLDKALKPITEGVTPAGNKLSVSAVTATVEQFGDYIEQTDLLELTAVDNTIVEATRELAAQAGLTLDTVVREVMNAGTNVLFSKRDNGDGTYTEIDARSKLTKDCPLTVKDVFRAATELKSVDAPKIGDSYVAIIHPKMSYALMQEAGGAWIDVHKYADPGRIYRGEIGTLGGVRFVEATEAKVFAPAVLGADGGGDPVRRVTVKTTLAQAGKTVAVNETLTAASDLNIPVLVNGTANTLTAITVSSGTTSLTFSDNVSTTDGTAGNVVCGYGGGKDGSAVFSTLFMGEGAYATTELSGGGLEHIVKQKGYGQDPLNQRSSIGWKATKTAKLLIPEYLLRVESTSPDLSLITEAN